LQDNILSGLLFDAPETLADEEVDYGADWQPQVKQAEASRKTQVGEGARRRGDE
jgi:hypothetical protein